MFKVKWRESHGGWRVTICREMGPHEFKYSELVPGEKPALEACARAEKRGLHHVANQIIASGGQP